MALGDGTPDVQFYNDLTDASYIELLEHLRRLHKKIGVIAYNASSLTGKAMREYVAGANRAIEMIHIPPHAPQFNPIETKWREIKNAIADIFFGGLDKMAEAIKRMLGNVEIRMTKMYDRLVPP